MSKKRSTNRGGDVDNAKTGRESDVGGSPTRPTAESIFGKRTGRVVEVKGAVPFVGFGDTPGFVPITGFRQRIPSDGDDGGEKGSTPGAIEKKGEPGPGV